MSFLFDNYFFDNFNDYGDPFADDTEINFLFDSNNFDFTENSVLPEIQPFSKFESKQNTQNLLKCNEKKIPSQSVHQQQQQQDNQQSFQSIKALQSNESKNESNESNQLKNELNNQLNNQSNNFQAKLPRRNKKTKSQDLQLPNTHLKRQRKTSKKKNNKKKSKKNSEGKQNKTERPYLLQYAGKFGIRRLQPFWDLLTKRIEKQKESELANQETMEKKQKKRTRFVKSKEAAKHFSEIEWHEEEIEMLKHFSPTQIKMLYYRKRVDVFSTALGLDERNKEPNTPAEDDLDPSKNIMKKRIQDTETITVIPKSKYRDHAIDHKKNSTKQNKIENDKQKSLKDLTLKLTTSRSTLPHSVSLENIRFLLGTSKPPAFPSRNLSFPLRSPPFVAPNESIEAAQSLLSKMPKINVTDLKEWSSFFDKVSLLGQDEPDLNLLVFSQNPSLDFDQLKIAEPHVFYADYPSIFGDNFDYSEMEKKIEEIRNSKMDPKETHFVPNFVAVLLALNNAINLTLREASNFPEIIFQTVLKRSEFDPELTSLTDESVGSLKLFLAWLELRLQVRNVLQIHAEKISLEHIQNNQECDDLNEILVRMSNLSNEMSTFKKMLLRIATELFISYITTI
ncbi:glycoprotein 96-92-related-related [Anaeramoeba ignava]|uniref:Glycoprotein 96-92-related-related n=1 Tax=Anaeramoeba ignava TaxID=1746090 RepID=A0A9Q0LHK4_ANAIG|nr:glycoprotein 96-92-related-related [Anaeramoeba ignava]